jgi:tetratricopeptide (TPR) repeat protein
LGRTDDAVEAFRAALRHTPTHARAQANLTAALADLKPPAPAPELNPLIAAAVTAVRSGDLERARLQAEAAVRRFPSSAEAHFTLGWVVHEAGSPKQAETHYRAALRCDPLHVSALTNLANVLTDLRRDAESLACAQRALAIRPDHASAWNAVGSALFELDHAAEAATAYRRALTLAPANARASNNLGAALQTLGRPEEAAGHYIRATAAHPGYVQAHSNLGAAMLDQGQLDEALEHLDKAVAVDPRDADSRLNRAFVRLMQGDYRQGWDDYEWRWQARRFPSPLRHTGRPLWSGEPLNGRTILLHAEQGFGDCLQFLRYVPLVAERGGRIVLEVQKELKRLVTGFPGVTTLIGRDEPIPPFDLQAPLLSLPRAFGTTPQTVPAAIPYLSADPERVTTWRRRLPADSSRIGIVWQGNPTARIDRGRSIPLHHFAPLAAIPGVRLIGLQQRHGLDQLKTLPAGMTVTIPRDDIDTGGNAFLDTAAIMTTLDLIVTSDTASAHLAGALGVPVWVALKFVPD